MDHLIIQPDEVTPEVHFNPDSGVLEMQGVAIPEDVREMSLPIIEWVEEYSKKPCPATELILFFDYLNTAASKMVYQLCDMLSDLHGNEANNVKIIWKYYRGDIEMLELGEEILETFICFKEIVAVERPI